MAKFDIVKAPKELPVSPTTAVRATGIDPRLGADTQAGQRLLVAAAGFQEQLARADLIDADNQSSAAMRGANRISNERNDLVLEAEDTEEETFRKISDSLTARILALRPKNEKAARVFDRRMSVLIPNNEEFIANARLKRIETNFLAEEQALLNDVKVGGSLGDYLIHLQKGKKLNIPGRQTDSEIKPLQQIGRATATQVAIQSAINGDDLLRAESLLLQAQSLTPQQVASLKKAITVGQKVVQDRADEQAKAVLLSKLRGLSADDAFAIIDADKTIPFDKKVDVRQEWSVRENAVKVERDHREKSLQEVSEAQIYADIVGGIKSFDQIRADINNRIITDADGIQPLSVVQAERLKSIMNNPVRVNDPIAVDEVSTAIAQVGNDTLSLTVAKDILSRSITKLMPQKVTEFQEELTKAFDASIDTASARVRSDVRLRAVGKTESALDRLIAAFAGAKPEDKKSLEERITTAREKFVLELDNFNRWESAQRAWRRTKPDATPEEIQKEGERAWFTEFAGKTIPELRAESAGKIAALKIPVEPERVRMISPDGKTGTIPADKVEQAVSQGWKRI